MGPASLLMQTHRSDSSSAQVWELDKKLLQQHALPLVEGYTWETGTVLKALEMDEFVPPPPNSKGRPGPLVPRRIQRSGR